MKRLFIIVIVIIVVLIGFYFIYQSLSNARHNIDSEITASVTASVTTEIIREELEGSAINRKTDDVIVIAEISSWNEIKAIEPYHWFDASYKSVWKYKDGGINKGDIADVDNIKRERNGPFYIIVVCNAENDMALVDIAVQYGKSNTVGYSGGGNASHWKLENIESNWTVVEKMGFMSWD